LKLKEGDDLGGRPVGDQAVHRMKVHWKGTCPRF